MDLQKLIDAHLSKARDEDLANSDQLLLGELKLKLESVGDKTKPIVFDFGMKPAGASSWRGSYMELGLEYSENGGGSASWNGSEVEWESEDKKYRSYKSDSFEIPENPTAQNFLDMLKALTDKEMVGYKGGDFSMHKNVAIYLGNNGESGVPSYRGKDWPTVAVFDIVESADKVTIITREVF